jgi:hypothetical protein
LAVALAVAACGDGPGNEEAAVVGALYVSLCDRLTTCGCLPPDDEFICVEPRGFQPEPEAADPAFDPQCAQDMVELVRGLDCNRPFELSYADLCPIYHGSILEGQACADLEAGVFGPDGEFIPPAELGSCGPRLFCIQGICRDPTTVSFGGLDEPCDLLGCDGELACIAGLCQPLPLAGQPCALDPNAGDGECAEGARCIFDGDVPMCEAVLDVGAPCTGHSQCASGNCPRGNCEPPAAVGAECSTQLPCAPELDCIEGVCTPLTGDSELCQSLFGVGILF